MESTESEDTRMSISLEQPSSSATRIAFALWVPLRLDRGDRTMADNASQMAHDLAVHRLQREAGHSLTMFREPPFPIQRTEGIELL